MLKLRRIHDMKLSHLAARLDRMPMLKAVVPLMAGIALAAYVWLPWWFIAAAFAVAGVVALLMRSGSALAAMLLMAGFGAAQFNQPECTVVREVWTEFEIVVEGIPVDRGRYTAAEARVEAWCDPEDGVWHPSGDRIMLRSDSLTPLDGGERLCVNAIVRPIRGGAESYRRLMSRRGFVGTIYLSGRNIIERLPGEHDGLHRAAVRRLQRLPIAGDAAAVSRAMTAGDKSGITPSLRAAYSRSGLAHLLSVSGLHTGIVFVLVNLLLWWVPIFRYGHLARNVLAAACIWLFVAAAGFPPSAVRAAVMFTVLQFALVSASQYTAMNALAAAALGMLLYNPAWLADISFQLSFVAVAGILAWGVPLCRKMRTRYKAVNYLIDALVISFVASVVTAPLISHSFGIVPLAGLLVNPIAIPLAGVVVTAGTIWMIMPVAWLGGVFGFVLNASAGAINFLARLTASVPGSAAEYTLGIAQTAAIYLIFVAATAVVWCREPKKGVHLPR